MVSIASELSWGRVHRFAQHRWDAVDAARLDGAEGRPIRAYGRGRSYGDSCLNEDGVLVGTKRLDRFLAFDLVRGILRAEAGVTLADIVNLLARRRAADGSGWFLPVSPGTAVVTLGGALANDVHGKNHHLMGSFGNHVRAFTLLRSDGQALLCTPDRHGELFRATIGGLGLTGLILDVEIQLRHVVGFAVESEDLRFHGLDDFHALAAESTSTWEYTVAWIDCTAGGRGLGRGIFSRASHVPGAVVLPEAGKARVTMPFTPPVSPLNRWTVSAFNALYWRHFWPRARRRRRLPVTAILYPLDGIAHWNRLYGRGGLYQYQCVLPPETAAAGVRELLAEVGRSGEGSFLSVLKTLGERRSPGLLSFPMAGITLALDFPNRGPRTLALLDRLDAITGAAGGRLYPAKDDRMDGRLFPAAYSELDRFARQVDPAFSSSFWRRMGVAGAAAPVAA